MNELESKIERLRAWMRAQDHVAVAYSGGVDSSLVLKVATDELGSRVVALLAVSASLPASERAEAHVVARLIGAEVKEVATSELSDARYQENAANRCYFCKVNVYASLLEHASQSGDAVLVDGMNADDTMDIRPGRAAARELGVRSPLHELGFTKAEVRAAARRLGLPNWDKPAAACLSSRIPYGTPVTEERLAQVEKAESELRALGFGEVRVRHHGDVARVELPVDQLQLALHRAAKITSSLRRAGFTFVSLDLDGLRSGSLNEPLRKRVTS